MKNYWKKIKNKIELIDIKKNAFECKYKMRQLNIVWVLTIKEFIIEERNTLQ